MKDRKMRTEAEKIERMRSIAKSGFMGIASDDTTSQFSV